MTRFASLAGTVGLVITLMTAPAQADIRITVTASNGFSSSTTTAGNFAIYNAGPGITIETTIDNQPGAAGLGTISSTLNFRQPTAGAPITSLTVLVEELLPFNQPNTPTGGYLVENTATVNSDTALTVKPTLTGSATLQPDNLAPVTNVAPVTATGGLGVAGNTQVVNPPAATYILSHTFTLNMIGSSTSLYTGTLRTDVSAVPEPSSLALTALTALGVIGLRRRRRVQSV